MDKEDRMLLREIALLLAALAQYEIAKRDDRPGRADWDLLVARERAMLSRLENY